MIIETIKSKNDFLHGKPADVERIHLAQKELELEFAEEYKVCINTFGWIICDGHEITSITDVERLDVVKATKKCREYYKLEGDQYLIEDTGYEGIIIVQNTDGEVFQCMLGASPVKICDSLENYLNEKYN